MLTPYLLDLHRTLFVPKRIFTMRLNEKKKRWFDSFSSSAKADSFRIKIWIYTCSQVGSQFCIILWTSFSLPLKLQNGTLACKGHLGRPLFQKTWRSDIWIQPHVYWTTHSTYFDRSEYDGCRFSSKRFG